MADSGQSWAARLDVSKLLKWFAANRRELPWRLKPAPYSVWVSEVMLQQTVVGAVIGHYRRWMKHFPTVRRLAAASEQDVVRMWEGLGYYSRARNLRLAAKLIVSEHGGKFPEDYEDLRKLPGIGEYTASAILSIAYGKPYPVLDANVRRVMQRFLLLRVWNRESEMKLRSFLNKAIPQNQPGEFNEALMELGQMVCLRNKPLCKVCPLAKGCRAQAVGAQEEIPVCKSKAVERIETTIAIYLKGKRVLLARRYEKLFRGLWLFPEANGAAGQKLAQLKERTHHYTRYANRLSPVIIKADKTAVGVEKGLDSAKWIPIAELEQYPMPSVYRKIAAEFREWFDNLA